PFNFVSVGLENGGFYDIWEDIKNHQLEIAGQEYAKRHVDTMKFYGGNPDHFDSNRQVVGLSLHLLLYEVEDVDTFPIESLSVFELQYLSAYFVFIFSNHQNSNETSTEQLFTFANSARKLPQSFFLIITDNSVNVYASEGVSIKKLIRVYTSNNKKLSFEMTRSLSVKNMPINFQKQDLVSVVCAVCEPKEEDGKWLLPSIMATVEFSEMINATLLYEPLFADFKTVRFENGEWDDWLYIRYGQGKKTSAQFSESLGSSLGYNYLESECSKCDIGLHGFQNNLAL
ncbi:unnamed protein product, partial [Allacma fusca]